MSCPGGGGYWEAAGTPRGVSGYLMRAPCSAGGGCKVVGEGEVVPKVKRWEKWAEQHGTRARHGMRVGGRGPGT
jgi:hypothetical protein